MATLSAIFLLGSIGESTKGEKKTTTAHLKFLSVAGIAEEKEDTQLKTADYFD
jgi:hypothetical protein